MHPIGKPDCDNLAKAVLDCITQLGCFWRDDSQVVHLTISKEYTLPPPGLVVAPGLVVCIHDA
jgi:Holliday junction resolvase RusA-like endonuclease